LWNVDYNMSNNTEPSFSFTYDSCDRYVRRERYGEGESPYEAKTGSGPILLTCSLPLFHKIQMPKRCQGFLHRRGIIY